MFTRILFIVLVAILLIGGFMVINRTDERAPATPQTQTPREEDEEETQSEMATYRNPDIGLSFTYAGGEEGYHLQAEQGEAADGEVAHIVLTPMADYRELALSDVPREGPPTITFRVFENTEREWSTTWVTAHSEITNSNLALTPITDTVIGGANAVRFTADGLYPTDTVVVAHGSYVYVITGSYLDETSRTRTDFNPLLQSIAFIPEA